MAERGVTFQDLAKIGVTEPGRGLTFFVDTTNGANTNSGLSPNEALATITAALGKCVADRRDTIFVLLWDTDNGETWPLPMSVAGVTLMAKPYGARYNQNRAAYIVCPDNTAVIALSAHRCSLVGLMLSCPAAYDAITFSGTPAWTGIRECYFAVCNDGVGGGASNSTTIGWTSEIINCMFTHSVTDHGIYVANPAHILIQGNVFSRVEGTVALEAVSPGRPRILDNRFGLNADLEGAAIKLGGSAEGGVIDGNHANAGATLMAENPYLDLGTLTTNDWGLNYKALVATMPAFA